MFPPPLPFTTVIVSRCWAEWYISPSSTRWPLLAAARCGVLLAAVDGVALAVALGLGRKAPFLAVPVAPGRTGDPLRLPARPAPRLPPTRGDRRGTTHLLVWLSLKVTRPRACSRNNEVRESRYSNKVASAGSGIWFIKFVSAAGNLSLCFMPTWESCSNCNDSRGLVKAEVRLLEEEELPAAAAPFCSTSTRTTCAISISYTITTVAEEGDADVLGQHNKV
mmetsp:Transcript_16780/g.41543  ORF Transcript_16780/g.41543 Transcript_16780/m.41543 type:complete len:222 (-) Transcript_16780:249-914(-)